MANRRPLIVNSSSNQIQEIADSDGLIGNGTIPVGGIIMWSGTIASIPTGWALCNGSSSTPDLRNRFIVGAHSGAGNGTSATTGPTFSATTGALSANYTPGNSGGETSHQLTIAELASHTHPFTQFNGTEKTGSGGSLAVNYYSTGSTNTTSTGGDQFHENRPPYYALAFIMRTL